MKKLFKRLLFKSHEIVDWSSIDLVVGKKEKKLIEEFASQTSDERMQDIMLMGDSGDASFFQVLQYAILYDNDYNVKFSALKRIHLYKDHPSLLPMMQKLRDENKAQQMEPYYSMALNRLGLINIDEFSQRISSES